MGAVGVHRLGARVHQRDRGVAQGAARVHDVVQQDAAAVLHVADDVHHFRHAGALAPLVDDGEIGVQTLGQRAGAHHAADVRRHHGHLADVGEGRADVLLEHRGGHQVVRRDVEEALDLARVQVHRQHAVGAGLGDQVGDQLGRDRRAGAGLPVLARVAVVGDDRRDAPGRPATQGVDGDQQLHQVVVGRERRRLDDEHVLAAHVLQDFDEHLHVRKTADARFGQRHAETGGDGLGQRTVAVAGKHLHRSRLSLQGNGFRTTISPMPTPPLENGPDHNKGSWPCKRSMTSRSTGHGSPALRSPHTEPAYRRIHRTPNFARCVFRRRSAFAKWSKNQNCNSSSALLLV